MVNGTLSRILYIGALALIALCLTGKMILAGLGKESGGDVTLVLTSLMAFLFGTHVTPLLPHKPTAVVSAVQQGSGASNEQTNG